MRPTASSKSWRCRPTLGSALMATKGYAAPEVERAYARARTLCQQVEETPELFRVLMGLHMFYRQRAELHTSSEIGAQLLSLAQSVENPEFLLVAHQALGTTLYFLGDFVQARAHLEQGVALSDSRQPSLVPSSTGRIPAWCACPRWPEPCGRSGITTMP